MKYYRLVAIEDLYKSELIFSSIEAGKKWIEYDLNFRMNKGEALPICTAPIRSWKDVSDIRNDYFVAAYDVWFEGFEEPDTIYLEECEFNDLVENKDA